MAGGGYNRVTPSIILFNGNLQLEGVCTSKNNSSRHKIYLIRLQYFVSEMR
jgi:hypothetical protein